ncbi:rust resistance kinase Lr10-like [Euphorbia lathyris]|uniref:rust resistance kinase Lr10-like n=1 Tax=Euphorbia lathyris TaxID=212925 RepID=UPI0033130FD8
MLHKTLTFAFIIFLFLFQQQPCTSQKLHHCEHPSSCGTLINISYPFRLKSDPSNCGDANYELSCENNQPFLNLYSGKYHVRSINYNNSTIRVVDVGVSDGNCSSIPLYTLSYANFHWKDPFHLSHNNRDDVLMFLSCRTSMESDVYIDASSCVNGEGYQYVLVGEVMASEVGDWCTIDQISPIDLAILRNEYGNVSIKDVRRSLESGFELSWSNIVCGDCRKQGFCIFERDTSMVRCTEACSFYHVSSLHCAVQLAPVYFVFLSFNITFFIGLLTATKCICGAPVVFIFLILKWRKRHLSMFDSVEEFLQNHNNLMPIRYSYSQLKKMTNDFKNKLGEGGCGSVYKGKLRSGNFVAVKILSKSRAEGQEFVNEVATIGRIHHVNIVKLIGFCADGSKRALIYEFMPNGSLDKYVLSSENNISLSWEKIYEISLGVARGIEYLHCGCDMQILHFDIKPHNILLDENFTPKVSDFGLAKLCPNNSNNIGVTLTGVRGTIGYIAPELLYKNIGGVSYKADVYSFGMLLMEMAGKRNKKKGVEDADSSSEESYFPFSMYDQLMDGKEIEIDDGTEEFEKKIVKKIVMVALWCIQINPSNRPPMNKVVKMLEELESIPLPPRLFLYPEETSVTDTED